MNDTFPYHVYVLGVQGEDLEDDLWALYHAQKGRLVYVHHHATHQRTCNSLCERWTTDGDGDIVRTPIITAIHNE